MALRPQDLVVALRLLLAPGEGYAPLAAAVGLSLAEVHRSVRRATESGLLDAERKPNRAALREFIVHGARYAFPPKRGRMTRGTPTAHGAPPLRGLVANGADPIPVWPDADGTERGEAFEPLYGSVPEAARKDARLHELLALVDAIRDGRARERSMAEELLAKYLG